MRDPLLDSLAALFDEVDPPPEVIAPNPTGCTPMDLVPMRGPEQLTFHLNNVTLRLQIDGTDLIGIAPPNTTVRMHQQDVTDYGTNDEGWFHATIRRGPICVSLPEQNLMTGWFVA